MALSVAAGRLSGTNLTVPSLIAVKRTSFYAAIGVSVVVAAYDGWLYWQYLAPSDDVLRMHQFVVSVSLTTWVAADTRVAGRTQPSFDYGWFVLAVLPIYGPFYLAKTRRWRGVLMAVGGAFLFLLPWVAEVLAGSV